MSVDDLFRIGGPAGQGPPERVDPAADSTEFRRLLEQLENLSRPPDTAVVGKAGAEEPEVTDADDLQDALRRAEDDFVSAMDLRRQLEEAFRRSQS